MIGTAINKVESAARDITATAPAMIAGRPCADPDPLLPALESFLDFARRALAEIEELRPERGEIERRRA